MKYLVQKSTLSRLEEYTFNNEILLEIKSFNVIANFD